MPGSTVSSTPNTSTDSAIQPMVNTLNATTVRSAVKIIEVQPQGDQPDHAPTTRTSA